MNFYANLQRFIAPECTRLWRFARTVELNKYKILVVNRYKYKRVSIVSPSMFNTLIAYPKSFSYNSGYMGVVTQKGI